MSFVAKSLRRADTTGDAVILIDDNDMPLGTMEKLEAHRRGLTHRAISVILRDGAGRLLLQQRAASKYHSPGLWTNTCCSHPRPNENTAEAAARRLHEEMGVATPLAPLFTMHYRAEVPGGLIEDEVVHVFGGRFDGAPAPDPQEVSDWRWAAPDDVLRDVSTHRERYTVWFRLFCRDHWDEIATQVE